MSCLQCIEQPVAQEPITQISRVIAQIHHSFKDNPALHLAGDLLAPAQSLSQFKISKQLCALLENLPSNMEPNSAQNHRHIWKCHSVLFRNSLFKSAIISCILSPPALRLRWISLFAVLWPSNMVSGYFQSLYNWRFKSPSTVQMTSIPVNHNRDVATEYSCRHPSHQDNLCRYVMSLQTDVISCMASRSAPVTGAFPPYRGPLPFGALPPAIDVLGDETRNTSDPKL